jgi:multiple sugar transport system permease protein
MLNENYMRNWEKLVIYVILALFAVVMIAPFLVMLSTSLKTPAEVNQVPPVWIPPNPHWQNYIDVWTVAPMGRYLLNSIFVTVSITAGTLVTSALGAYALARLSWLGRDKIFLLFIGTMMVPFAIVLIPFYQLIKALNWVNSYEALIIPWIFSPYGAFLLRQFFLTIPQDLEDSMIVEGASRLRILVQLFVPLTKPALVTLAVFTALNSWNSFLWPLVVTSSEEKFMLPVGLNLLAGSNNLNLPLIMAAVTITVLPTILLFLFAQRWFVESIATTGLRQ